MRNILLFVAVCVSFVVSAQTELPSTQYLNDQYNLKVSTEQSYSVQTTPIKYADNKYVTILTNSGKISSNTNSYTPRSLNSVLVLWDSEKGKMEAFSELGDDLNNISITETQLTPDGKIFVFGGSWLSKTKSLILGSQTFNFRTDTLPGYISAIFNPLTKTWEQVNFYYVGDRYQDNYMSNVKHLFDSNGNVYFCGSFVANYIVINEDTIIKGSKSSFPFFVAKLNSDYTKIWSKQCTYITNNTSLYNLTFNTDATNNVFIAGGIGYISGEISLDGVKVKNDTILDAYDYTYTDLFLYKLNSDGVVQFGKTYLFRGTEQLSEIVMRKDGGLYMCGDFNGEFVAPGGTFTGTGNDLRYNTFIVKINPATGNFDWGQPVHGNLDYSERLRKIRIDADDNVYLAARFQPLQITFMGNTFNKRTDNVYADQVLFAKISKDGAFNWGSVLGATTSYPDVIEHQLFRFWEIEDTLMYLSVPQQSYGTNKVFEWGNALVASTRISTNILGNTAVISTTTGNVKFNYGKELAALSAIDSIDFMGMNSDFMEYNFCRITNKTTNLTGRIIVNDLPLVTTAYIYVELLSLNSADFGSIKAYGSVDALGNYSVTNVPHGSYIAQVIPYDSTLLSSYYKQGVPANWQNADTLDLNSSLSDIDIYLQKLAYPTGTGTIEGTIVVESAINPSVQYISNVQIVLYSLLKTATPVAAVRPYKYENNTYSFKFDDIPEGTYTVGVEYPFATAVENASVEVSATKQEVKNVDFVVRNDKIYKDGTVFTEPVVKEEPQTVVYNNTTKTVNVNSSSAATVSIYNVTGSQMYSGACKNITSINVSNFPSGFYFVKVGDYTKKIVIVK